MLDLLIDLILPNVKILCMKPFDRPVSAVGNRYRDENDVKADLDRCMGDMSLSALRVPHLQQTEKIRRSLASGSSAYVHAARARNADVMVLPAILIGLARQEDDRCPLPGGVYSRA